MTWKLIIASSSGDHGTRGHFFSKLGRLPKAKAPKEDFHACFDALMMVFKGHVVVSACMILKSDGLDAKIPLAESLAKQSMQDQRTLVLQLK